MSAKYAPTQGEKTMEKFRSDLHNIYAFDIETVASNTANTRDYVKNMYIKPDSRLKDPVKIIEREQRERDKIIKKGGLHWATGKVCCVSFVDCETLVPYTQFSMDERSLLEFVQEMSKHDGETVKLIGKTSEGFDFPFLTGRFMANSMTVPKQFNPLASGANRGALDIDKAFGYSASSGQRGTLDLYALGMGLSGKGGMHGSKVQDLYDRILMADKENAKILIGEMEKYCTNDSIIVADMFRRLMRSE